jgi:Xaa-Pro aminopeptidase
MKELRFQDFPREEFLARYAITQQILKRHGLDALFLTQRQNLRYFAGLRDGAWDAYHFYFMVLLPVAGDPVLIVANGFNHLVEQCWIEDVRYWPWQKEFYLAKESAAVPLVVQTLKEKYLAAGVIGMELSPDIHVHMGQQHFDPAIGHSLGQDIHELPGLSAGNTALIQENMVLSVEPYITLNGVFPFWEAAEKFGLEDVVVVTKDGAEILTSEEKITHELWIA